MTNTQETKIKEIFSKLGLEVTLEPQARFGGEVVSVETADPALLIGRDGSHLDAIQLIINIALARAGEEKVALDVSGWRQSKEEKAIALADQIASEVKSQKRAREIRDLPAWLRRLIHLHLAEDPEVDTYSEGEGEERRLIIYPRKSQ